MSRYLIAILVVIVVGGAAGYVLITTLPGSQARLAAMRERLTIREATGPRGTGEVRPTPGVARQAEGEILEVRAEPTSVVAPVLELSRESECAIGVSDSVQFRGQVRNVSSEPLRGVVAQIRYLDRAGVEINVVNAFASVDPLAPGQVANLISSGQPSRAVDECAIVFRDATGASLPYRVGS